MEDKNKGEKMEEVVLPGFRFHPTDEELVSFYLKRKVQQRPLSIELIRQLDIYKYDPWDLPKFAMTGEKEWYFFCPRDRKYRNSARPNRVTGAGFWKATGTDRPIYSSDGNKCIGLKKSLVFYRGRAAKGIKTDWMMHEFRLPSLSDSSASPKRFFDKALPPNDSWAICRIFKKTNTTAQRALSHSFVSSLPPETTINTLDKSSSNTTQFCSVKNPKTSTCIQFHLQNINSTQQQPYSTHDNATNICSSTTTPLSFFDFTSYNKPMNTPNPFSCDLDQQDLTSFLLAPQETRSQFPKFTVNDISSFLLNMSSESSVLGEYVNHLDYSNIDFGAVLAQEQCPALVSLPQEYQDKGFKEGGENCSSSQMKSVAGADEDRHYWETIRSLGFGFGNYSASTSVGEHQDLKQNILPENYCYSSLIDGDLSACFSTNKCFT